ncbi:MAG: PKD domain-containing protein, partial [Bacteroidota bacterium]
YLTCGSTPSLDADFAADTEADCGNSLAVQFCDLSAGSPTAWSWDFGDGNSATNQHPSHTYTGAGIYDVSLTVTRGGSSDTETYSAKIKVGTVGIPYTNDFESATALNQWKITNSMKNNISMNAAASNGGSMGLMMDGASVWASPYFYLPAIAANAFDELQNPYYKSLMELCVDATAYENLSLSFDLRQMHFNSSGYTNFRVLVNGSQEGSVYQANTSENWNTITVDLSAYDQTSFTLGFESSVVYENALGAANYLDNINLIGTATLPVEYASFTVAQQGAHVQLDWATLSESNNKGFDVLRSSDQENWQSLGFVPANTTSPATKHYQFMDWQGASQSSDKLYYQLRQVDFDGRTELSDIREVRLQSLSQLLAYPNPSQGELTVIVPRSEPNQVVLQVSDLRGRLILTQKGADDFAGLNQAFRLNLAGLKAGLYLLQVRNGQKHYTQKIVLE